MPRSRSKLDNSAKVIQYTRNGAIDEKWWYDSDSKTLWNVYSGKCHAIGSAATNPLGSSPVSQQQGNGPRLRTRAARGRCAEGG
ncbi:hypothetical protein [Streptomyces coffeae]|uniref:Uncharacterized protein n=1 Tax=Streptomyces coffeae TaxID=621382 RepID=A0ABS1NQN0_9ACTN|nr:hypothetical protein [Streptomyces coffeae]MBL1102270.1 hypothetical protein [Streptomyces coffeae]